MSKKLAALLCCGLVGAAAAQEPDSKPSREELDKLLKSTDAIAQTVSTLRGLPIKAKIVRGIMSKDEILKRLILRLDEDSTPEEMAGNEKAMKRLGLMPADMNLRSVTLAVLTEQIAGFYDPTAKELYIADWIDATAQRMVMAHEIDHALQDQTFNLTKFMKGTKDDSDEQLAHQAVAEGDGFALMIEFLFRDSGQKTDPWADDRMVAMLGNLTAMASSGELASAPLFMREGIVFPYTYGLKFVAASRKTHPWADVDQMYRHPPVSSEQIMHPEKYRAGELPIVIKPPTLAAFKGYKKIYDNTVGEMMWSVLLRQHGVAAPAAEKAAAGWGGDHIMVMEQGHDVVALELSVWDAEMDAIEMFDALAEALPHLGGAAKLDEKTETYAACSDAAGNQFTVERKGAQLALVVGAPKDLAPRLRAEIWAKWKK